MNIIIEGTDRVGKSIIAKRLSCILPKATLVTEALVRDCVAKWYPDTKIDYEDSDFDIHTNSIRIEDFLIPAGLEGSRSTIIFDRAFLSALVYNEIYNRPFKEDTAKFILDEFNTLKEDKYLEPVLSNTFVFLIEDPIEILNQRLEEDPDKDKSRDPEFERARRLYREVLRSFPIPDNNKFIISEKETITDKISEILLHLSERLESETF